MNVFFCKQLINHHVQTPYTNEPLLEGSHPGIARTLLCVLRVCDQRKSCGALAKDAIGKEVREIILHSFTIYL